MIVSIIIPTYNRANFLQEAIASALGQTYSELEVLVLDDASTDSTSEIVSGFQDGRIRYVRHLRNIGIAANWRYGIEQSVGEFFCFLHDDDTFEPRFVEALMAPLLQDDALVLSFSDHWIMSPDGCRQPSATDDCSRRFGRNSLNAGRLQDFAKVELVDDVIPVGATLFRRHIVKPEFIDEAAKGAIDAWLFYRCVKTGMAAFYVPERLMNYRAHDGGMSASQRLYMWEGHVFRYRAILVDPEMKMLHKLIRQRLAHALADVGIDLLKRGRAAEARASLQSSVREQVTWRGVIAFGVALLGGRATGVPVRISNWKRNVALFVSKL